MMDGKAPNAPMEGTASARRPTSTLSNSPVRAAQAMEFKMKKTLLAAALVASSGVHAEIDPIVITYETNRLGLNERQTAQTITVFDQQDLEQGQYQNLSQVITSIPSFSLTSPTSRNQKQNIRLNGQKQAQVLVLVDGVPQSDGRNGYPDLSVFSLENVERIEIIRGNASAQLGSGAIAGAILISTKRPGGNETILSAQAGSFGTHRLGLQHSTTQSNGWSFSGSLYDERSEGFDAVTSGSPDKDGYDDMGATIAARGEVADGVLDLSFTTNRGEIEYDDGINEFDNRVARLSWTDFSWAFSQAISDSTKKAVDSNAQDYLFKQYQTELTYSFDATTLAGINYLREDTSGSSLSSGNTNNTFALFAEKLFEFERVNVHAASRAVDNENWGSHEAITISVSRRDNNFAPFINLGTSFRAPTELDVNGYDGDSDGSLDTAGVDIPSAQNLKVETGIDAEVGFRFANDRLTGRLSVRGSKLSDAISGGYAASGSWGSASAGASNSTLKTKTYGGEIDLRYAGEVFEQNFGISRSVRVEGDDRKSISPEYTASYRISGTTGLYQARAGVRFESERSDQYSATEEFFLVDVGISRQLNENLNLGLSVKNLFDLNYTISGNTMSDGANGPGRDVSVKATYRF